MGEENQKDFSVWTAFFNDHVVFMNDITLLQILQDVIDEITVRKTDALLEKKSD